MSKCGQRASFNISELAMNCGLRFSSQLSTINSQPEYLQFPGCILPFPDFLDS